MTPASDGDRATPSLDDAVEQVLGAGARLRESQRDALDGLREHDTLLVARSGAGKTAVYAIATLRSGRTTLVVSPLVALQQDQAEGLRAVGLRARTLSSALPAAEQADVLAATAAGEVDVLLLAPEQLVREQVLEELARADVGLLVVDEAHCVSEWGHGFRPDYLHVAPAAERLGRPRVLATTATASGRTREEIVSGLALRDPRVLVHDADRPNIWLGASVHADGDARDAAVVEAAVGTQGAGIVYARTRRHAEELARRVEEAGRPALVDHGGLPARTRAETERAFLSGAADLVVATSAFGMGVDRADVRFVLHAGAPPSLDAYYQEVGRAGRDEEPALALLAVTEADWALGRYLGTGGGSRPTTLRAVLHALEEGPADRAEVARRAGASPRTVARALSALAHVGAVVHDDGRWRRAGDVAAGRAVERVTERRRRLRALDESRVEMVRTYAETTDCRRRLLLELLGEEHRQRCGRCDSCDAGTSLDVDDDALRPGADVEHAEWGPGTVQSVEEGRLTVLFDERGYVTLEPDLALGTGVLRRTGGEPDGPGEPVEPEPEPEVA